MNKTQHFAFPLAILMIIYFIVGDILSLLFVIGMQPDSSLFSSLGGSLRYFAFLSMPVIAAVALIFYHFHPKKPLFYTGVLLFIAHLAITFIDY